MKSPYSLQLELIRLNVNSNMKCLSALCYPSGIKLGIVRKLFGKLIISIIRKRSIRNHKWMLVLKDDVSGEVIRCSMLTNYCNRWIGRLTNQVQPFNVDGS